MDEDELPNLHESGQSKTFQINNLVKINGLHHPLLKDKVGRIVYLEDTNAIVNVNGNEEYVYKEALEKLHQDQLYDPKNTSHQTIVKEYLTKVDAIKQKTICLEALITNLQEFSLLTAREKDIKGRIFLYKELELIIQAFNKDYPEDLIDLTKAEEGSLFYPFLSDYRKQLTLIQLKQKVPMKGGVKIRNILATVALFLAITPSLSSKTFSTDTFTTAISNFYPNGNPIIPNMVMNINEKNICVWNSFSFLASPEAQTHYFKKINDIYKKKFKIITDANNYLGSKISMSTFGYSVDSLENYNFQPLTDHPYLNVHEVIAQEVASIKSVIDTKELISFSVNIRKVSGGGHNLNLVVESKYPEQACIVDPNGLYEAGTVNETRGGGVMCTSMFDLQLPGLTKTAFTLPELLKDYSNKIFPGKETRISIEMNEPAYTLEKDQLVQSFVDSKAIISSLMQKYDGGKKTKRKKVKRTVRR